MVVPIGRSDLPPICPAPAPLLVSRGFVHLAETPPMARKKTLDFEQSLTELQTLVERLESGELSLEESLGAFEQGIRLTRECQTSLSQAEQKVQILAVRCGRRRGMIAAYQARCQARVDAALDALFVAPREELQRLYEAMRYSVMNGGKRVRPLLAYAACEALGGAPQRADAAACAVELIHAYSLVHDDLPAMDDDDLRRGQPTTHRAFDEATAILAADGLQALAFEVLADTRRNPQEHAVCLEMLTRLARAAGSAGMVGGQAIDLGSVGVALDQAALEVMHRHKTGALIEASVRLGALASGRAEPAALAALERYAEAIGLAFQVQDDILDVESDTATLGKTQGKDQAHNKPTYPALLGLEAAKGYALELRDLALAALDGFPPSADPLRQLARYIVERRN